MSNRLSSVPDTPGNPLLHRHAGRITAYDELQIDPAGDDYTLDGSGAITRLPALPAGTLAWLKATGAPVFKNSGRLICPNALDYTASAEDLIVARSSGDGKWSIHPLRSNPNTLTGVVTLSDGNAVTLIDSVSMGRGLFCIKQNFTTAVDQFGVVVQCNITAPTGASASYEKAAGLFWCQTSDPSTVSIHADAVGVDARGFIANNNSLGAAWGSVSYAQVNSGGTGDGQLYGQEVDVINNGSDQASVATTTSKYGTFYVAGGSNPCTAAIWIGRVGSGLWHKGVYADSGAMATGGADSFLELSSKFIVTPAGKMCVGGVSPIGNLSVHNTTDKNFYVGGNVTNPDGVTIGSINDANTVFKGLQVNASNVLIAAPTKVSDTTASTSSTSGALIVSGGFGLTGDLNSAGAVNTTVAPSTAGQFSTSGMAGIAVNTGSNGLLFNTAGAGYQLVHICENVSIGVGALYLVEGGAVVFIAGTGGWVAPTTTPAAGKMSLAYDGTSAYRIYNNSGTNGTFRATCIKSG